MQGITCVIVPNLPIFIRSDEATVRIHAVCLHTCSSVTELRRDAAAGTVFAEQAPQWRGRAARVREKEMPHMTESLPSIQRRMTTATGTPTRLNRPDVTPADSAEGCAGVEPVVEPAVAEAPILITEQEVPFSTAAAVTVPSKKTAAKGACCCTRVSCSRVRWPMSAPRSTGTIGTTTSSSSRP